MINTLKFLLFLSSLTTKINVLALNLHFWYVIFRFTDKIYIFKLIVAKFNRSSSDRV